MNGLQDWPPDELARLVAMETLRLYPGIAEDLQTLARVGGAEILQFMTGKGRYAEDHAKAKRGELGLSRAASIIGSVCAKRLATERARTLGLGIWDFTRRV